MDYEQLLERAHTRMPESVKVAERFEIPKIRGHVQGNKTIISNFSQIVSVLNRDGAHILKYILRELATPGEQRKGAVLVGRKVSASAINEKLRKYAQEFVICRECGKPDTKIVMEGKISYLQCMACGARHPVKI